MLIEIRGTGTHNKGAELMCHVITEQLRASTPPITFAVERSFGTYEERAGYRLRTMLPERGKWGRARLLTALTRKSFREQFGLVNRGDLRAVLDASGFAFSDQWGTGIVEFVATLAEQCRNSGKPFILMPQAFGPFTGSEIRAAARRLFDAATLIFPREETSLGHVHDIGVSGAKVIRAHDFTVLAQGMFPEGVELADRFALVVPNARMLDRTEESQSAAYIDFLASTVEDLRNCDVTPYYLFHDWKSDSRVADAIDACGNAPVPRLEFHGPLELKGIIGRAQFIVGSRFHALVGALCQGVPVLASSWSHKYEELLREYGIPDFLVQPNDLALARDKIRELADLETRQEISHRLKQNASGFHAESLDVFSRVKRELLIDTVA